SAQGRAHLPFAIRRAGALALLGLAHSVLLWNVDILLDYALISLLVIPFLALRGSRILWAAPILLAATLALAALLSRGSAADMSYSAQLQRYGSGTWLEALRFRTWELVHVVGPMRLANRLPTLTPFFVLGAWFWRNGFLSEPEKHMPSLRRVFYISFG